MLRDLSLEGRAGEEALTILSDSRTVLTELDPRWDRRIVSHLVADQFWLRFAPQPLGPSDRRVAFADLRARFDRVLLASSELGELDRESRAMLRARMTDVTAEAAMLGDREDTLSLLERLLKVTSGDRFATELTQRLSVTKAGAIDVKGLLR
jgi:ABC-type sulfate/molybdate transport systems ATPase subunit